MAFKPVGQGSYPVYAPPPRQKVQAKEDKKGPVEVFEPSAKPSIVIIDCGLGNLRSVQKALEKVGFPALVTSRPEDVKNAQGLILPGVGAFGAAMTNLARCGLVQPIKDFIKSGKLFLGICLGLQVLFESSEEIFSPGLFSSSVAGPNATSDQVNPVGSSVSSGISSSPGPSGLAILPGRVKKFSFPLNPDLQIPHMGWNSLDRKKPLPLLKGVPEDAMFYFVHSYYVDPADPSLIGATTPYGLDFTSVVQKDNIFAAQFHPEKSGPVGLKILANFGRQVETSAR